MTDAHSDLRMLQVIAPAPYGGAESVMFALARAYPGAARLAALLQEPGPHPLLEQMRAAHLAVEEIRAPRRRYGREVDGVSRAIEHYRPHVVHAHVYHADFVAWFAARRQRVPVVATVHGFPGVDLKDRVYQWLDLRLLRRFDALICVSESVRARVLAAGCAASRVHLVPNPHAGVPPLPALEARARLGIPDGRPAVGWVGRLSVEKGADQFVRALARLPQPRPLGVIVGTGPELERIRSLSEELALDDDLRCVGERPNAGVLLSAFDALVLSSRTEGLPMVLLEAMGAQVPVVAFAVGGIPDAVSDRTGWLAAAGDVDALATALQRALAAPEEARGRAAAAAAIVAQRYGPHAWVRRICDIHRGVAHAAGLLHAAPRAVRPVLQAGD